MPVRRMTFLQAVDYFNSLQNEENDNDSDDDLESANASVDNDPENSGNQEHTIENRGIRERGDESDVSDGEIFIDEDTDGSDSEADDSDPDENSSNEFVSPNGMKWNSSRPVQRRLLRNITNFNAGPTIVPRTEVESFHLLLDDTILRTILIYTNRRV